MTLNDRERFILHGMSVMVVDLLIKRLKNDVTILENSEPISVDKISSIMEDIRIGRCRKMNVDEMADLYDEMKEEMLLGVEVHKDNI